MPDTLQINRWWRRDPEERFWLEITDRLDVGRDLNAPQKGDNGQEFWGYSLIREVGDGDIVFHYHKGETAIIGWSLASGNTWEDVVVWGARGTVAREAGVVPYARDGWRLGLEQFNSIEQPVTLKELRTNETSIRALAMDLQSSYGGSLYFPFALSTKRPLRPTQGYLAKLPLGVVKLIPSLSRSIEIAEELRSASSPPAPAPAETQPSLGAAYREADEQTAVSDRDPFTVDPALVERALQGHAKTQNELAACVREAGFKPLSPQAGEPNYDLCWIANDLVHVAEVKSLTSVNEEKQLRLGLGQVLRYRNLLAREGAEVRAILALEHEPQDPGWGSLCSELGVVLASPPTFRDLFPT